MSDTEMFSQSSDWPLIVRPGPYNLRGTDRSASSRGSLACLAALSRRDFFLIRNGIPRNLPQWFRTAMLVNTESFDRLAVANSDYREILVVKNGEYRVFPTNLVFEVFASFHAETTSSNGQISNSVTRNVALKTRKIFESQCGFHSTQ